MTVVLREQADRDSPVGGVGGNRLGMDQLSVHAELEDAVGDLHFATMRELLKVLEHLARQAADTGDAADVAARTIDDKGLGIGVTVSPRVTRACAL